MSGEFNKGTRGTITRRAGNAKLSVSHWRGSCAQPKDAHPVLGLAAKLRTPLLKLVAQHLRVRNDDVAGRAAADKESIATFG